VLAASIKYRNRKVDREAEERKERNSMPKPLTEGKRGKKGTKGRCPEGQAAAIDDW